WIETLSDGQFCVWVAAIEGRRENDPSVSWPASGGDLETILDTVMDTVVGWMSPSTRLFAKSSKSKR
ncbi:MAG TPA: hypothetical protein VHQ39_05875, partial [Dongiaceae bacterium]|nr:hypothetical protein [Dongiaceae bacterium]